VLITFEGHEAGDVASAHTLLIERLGARVVRHDAPALVGASS
jgi:hypothetical protein